MDIQKEREGFEKLWTDGNGHFRFFEFDQDDCKYQLNGVTDNLSKEDLLSASITLNTAWLFWLGAKKRAVPEGFVLIPVEPSRDTQHKIVLAMMKPAGTINDVYKAMIEAQEQK